MPRSTPDRAASPRSPSRCWSLAACVVTTCTSLALGTAPAFSATTVDQASPPPPRAHTVTVGDPRIYPAAPPPSPRAALRADSVAPPASPTFHVTYHGFSLDEQAAFQAALDQWAGVLSTPVTIEVDATMRDLGPDILGGAGPNGWVTLPAFGSGVALPRALANSIAGYDVAPGQADIVATIDDDGGGSGWYLGTDGATTSGEYDFESTVAHEIGHGLGFYASADSGIAGCPSSIGCFGLDGDNGVAPTGYDTHLTNGSTGPALLTWNGAAWESTAAPNHSAALLALFENGNIRFRGLYTDRVAPGGARLFSPPTWEAASSISHLDEAAYPQGNPEALMTPYLHPGEATHVVGPMTRALLADLGWYVPDVVDCPANAFVDNAYQAFLNRIPTSTEAATALDKLGHNTWSRPAFIDELVRGADWLPTKVRALYSSALDRPADDPGVDYWTQLVASRQLTLAQVAASLYSSDEGFARLGQGNLRTWVQALYQDVLDRPADQAGLDHWVTVASTYGRVTVAYAIYQSAESRSRRVSLLYTELLDRSPDPSGLAFWTAYLTNGDDVALASFLAGSDEYYLRDTTCAP